MVANSGSVRAKILLLPRANCLTPTYSRRISPVDFDCLPPKTSWPREKLPSIPRPCNIIENMLRTTLETSVYCECISCCWHHQSVMSGIQNVLIISSGLVWYSLRFGLICPQFSGASGGEFNRACQEFMSGLRDHFVWVSSQPHCQALSIPHHRWTNYMDQWVFDITLKPLQKERDWCSVRVRVY
jgi:hypothetical protein